MRKWRLVPSALVVGLATLGLSAAGCPAGGNTVDNLPDASVDAMLDATVDGQVEDSSPPDARLDAAPECGCPALPPTCAAPMLDEPTFTRDGDVFGQELMRVLRCADTKIQAAIYETDWDCLVDAMQTRLTDDADLTIELVIDDDQ